MLSFSKKLNYIGYGGNGYQVRDVLNIKDLVKLISEQTIILKILIMSYLILVAVNQTKFHCSI